MSLWTPDGERPVPPRPASEPARPRLADLAGAELGENERAEAEALAAEMADVQAQVAATPAWVVITNHVMGFYELAAIHLSQQPPQFAEASLAIDAMAAVLERLSERLGEPEPTLRDALAQLQLAFVELQTRTPDGT